MDKKNLKVLLIEDNPDHAELVRRHLDRPDGFSVSLEWVATVPEGIERLGRGDVDAVLLDLRLPGSEPAETLRDVLAHTDRAPVVVLTSLDDLEFAARAVQEGAQDYLVKTRITGELLQRSIRYAVERKRHAAELERSNRELHQFAHVVAHELKEPLCVLRLCYDAIRRRIGSKSDPSTDRLLQDSMDTAKGMARLIDDLLEYARVGEAERSFDRVECEEVLGKALANLRAAIEASGASVTHDALPTVCGDASQLSLLFRNLVGNAIRYRGGDPPVVHISTTRHDNKWRFSVRDNGVGIPPEHRDRVFRIFERLNPDKADGGSGIGLALCKRIVERHGGHIWVDSPEGRGSVFHFTLPAECCKVG